MCMFLILRDDLSNPFNIQLVYLLNQQIRQNKNVSNARQTIEGVAHTECLDHNINHTKLSISSIQIYVEISLQSVTQEVMKGNVHMEKFAGKTVVRKVVSLLIFYHVIRCLFLALPFSESCLQIRNKNVCFNRSRCC